MALINLQQEDTAPTCTAAELCSGLTATQGPIEQFATDGGSAGSGEDGSGNFPNADSSIRRTAYFDCPIPAGASWDSGDWTVRINHTAGDGNIRLQEVHICRVNSSCVNQATIGSTTGIAEATNVAQPQSVTVSGSAQSPSVGDRVVIVVGYDNAAAHGNHSIGITPDQIIDTPFDDGAGGPGPEIFRRENTLLRM